MNNVKANNWKIFEILFLIAIILFIIIQAELNQDNIVAVVSAICGIIYTFIAGKGNPFCYLFGITGSVFYCLLSFQNQLWGNLCLYAVYYVPMQILGYFQWMKNLRQGSNEIVKVKLPKKELLIVVLLP